MKRFFKSTIWILRLAAIGSIACTLPGLAAAAPAAQENSTTPPQTQDISGTWIAKRQSPMGEMEIVYKLKVQNGKITGTQSLPFGDSPIIDGQVTGDTFHFTVALESFGDIQNKEVTGKIVGDTLVLTPVMPGPPRGMGANGPGAGPTPGAGPPPGEGGPPPGDAGPQPGPPPGTSGNPGAGFPRFQNVPVTARRGTPTPSYRAPSVDYATLPKISLPSLHPVPTNALAKTPPMGWNSWNKFHTHIDDAAVRGVADAMASSGMKDAGYQYIIIDDGWQGSRDNNGVLSPNPNFPDMKALADYVHSKGLKIGIYSSPGPRTCGGFEGSYGHEEQDAKMYAAWGMDYLKYDWCSASRVWKDSDMQAAYQLMGDALTKTGRPIVYALCQYGRAEVQTWGQQVGANLWRTTGDIRDQYNSMLNIGLAQSRLASSAGPGHWNDPDMLEIGNGGMSLDEYKTHFSLWAMIAAPLIAGNDLRNMTPDIKDILTNSDVIAIDQDSLGAGGKEIYSAGGAKVWSKSLASGDIAVAVFNPGEQSIRTVLSLEKLGLSGKYQARDLWSHTDLGALPENFSVTVPVHGVAMLRLKKSS
ncbi:glycoside hydrolase family 27 protein [Acidicapsa dinghuensis]|uniref:Alpha-galactosidase n=1 Tax=Acidicapsa dinghuensis TaxID=2218256 RepID=A0ABW1EMX4_9BACT|nr:glycoside hydrolase family 27 protein [Acidicapsa dinghuensis]